MTILNWNNVMPKILKDFDISADRSLYENNIILHVHDLNIPTLFN